MLSEERTVFSFFLWRNRMFCTDSSIKIIKIRWWTKKEVLKEVLKEKLSGFPDEEVRKLLYLIIDSYAADTGKGLPMGNQSSQWFALYYLDRYRQGHPPAQDIQ